MSYDVHALRRAEFPWADAGENIFLNHAKDIYGELFCRVPSGENYKKSRIVRVSFAL